MRLTIIAPESVYEHEVDPSMEVRDVKALIEAEVGPHLGPLPRTCANLAFRLELLCHPRLCQPILELP